MIHNILIADANCWLVAFHANLLQQAGYEVATAHDITEARAQLQLSVISLVIAELAFPGSGSGDAVNLVRGMATLRPNTPVLVLTSSTDSALHREARRLGVWDICIKPTVSSDLLALTRNILEAVYPEGSGYQGHGLAGAALGGASAS